MAVAAQDRAVPQAHPNIGDPTGTGGRRRSQARLPDPQGPEAAAPDGREDRGLYGPDRPRGRTIFHAEATPALTDAATAFLQAIRAKIGDATRFTLDEIHGRRWASVTFQGARIELAFSLEGPGADESAGRLLGGLEARNFELRGHLLADLSLVAQERRPGFARIRLEALTVEER